MRTSESLGEIGAALAAASAEMPLIAKDRQATIPTKGGGSYAYRYADLARVLEAVRPVLAKHQLAILQSAGECGSGELVVATRVLHASGEWIEADGPAISLEGLDARGVGGAMTYARRYSLTTALGLAPDDDDDAAGVPGRSNGRSTNRGAGRGEAAPAVPDSAPPAAAAPPHAPSDDAERAELLAQAAEIFGSRAGALKAARARFGEQIHGVADISLEQLATLVAQGVLA